MKLQEYLNEEYPTKEEKEKVKEIDIRKINEKEKGLQFYKFLDGGELDLGELRIGTTETSLNQGKHNKFYGSLKSYQNLTKLTSICIEATDINEGLEYLPFSLAQASKGGDYMKIECSPHETEAKCSIIKE